MDRYVPDWTEDQTTQDYLDQRDALRCGECETIIRRGFLCFDCEVKMDKIIEDARDIREEMDNAREADGIDD